MNIELFFDYACPYCYKGHKNLLDLLESYPQLDITWRPCEAHPRPEHTSIHSDMTIQGMYYIRDHQGDIWKYHELAYEAVFENHSDISDLDNLAAMAAQCKVNPDDFKKSLLENRYATEVTDGNYYAWGEKGLNAVPSYLSGSHFIGSHDGVLVTKHELDEFLSKL